MAFRSRPALGCCVRLVEVYYAAVILSVLAFALFIPADDFLYDASLVRILVVMAASPCALWLIERRARAARRFVIATTIVVMVATVADIAFGCASAFVLDHMGMPLFVAAAACYFCASVAVVGYFAWSAHVRRIFVEPLDRKGESGGFGAAVDKCAPDSSEGINSKGSAPGATDGASGVAGAWEDEVQQVGSFEKPFTWPWIRNLFLYYCIFSILGHWAEIAFCWLIVLGVFMGDYDFSHAQLWSQWLYPYPAHGIALVLIVLVLYPLKQWLLKMTGGRVVLALVLSFLANALVCTSIDFTTGITANADYSLWDYRDLPFNFMGQIVLQNSIVYSLAATLIVWVVYPLMARALHQARPYVVDAVFFALCGVYAFLEVLYFVHIGPAGLVLG